MIKKNRNAKVTGSDVLQHAPNYNCNRRFILRKCIPKTCMCLINYNPIFQPVLTLMCISVFPLIIDFFFFFKAFWNPISNHASDRFPLLDMSLSMSHPLNTMIQHAHLKVSGTKCVKGRRQSRDEYLWDHLQSLRAVEKMSQEYQDV